MLGLSHLIPDLIIWAVFTATVLLVWTRTRGSHLAASLLICLELLVSAGVTLGAVRVARFFPNEVVVLIRGLAIMTVICFTSGATIAGVWAAVEARFPFDPQRRRTLRMARLATIAAPAAVLGFAYIQRDDLRLTEVEFCIPHLPKDLHNIRIVQISDIHLSPLVSERLLARAVDMANQVGPHLTVVTGDLISSGGDPLDTCLKQLARLRADAGVFGCLGNHEIYAGAEQYTTEAAARLGIRFLRQEAQTLRFGDARFNLVGVDYQKMKQPYLVGAEQLILPDMLNVLLSHNPDVFPVAVDKGYGLTLSGHTHGGQINVEILSQDLNVARFFTPYIYGPYSRGAANAFVSRGIGTIGLPARLGAPPEVAVIRLCSI